MGCFVDRVREHGTPGKSFVDDGSHATNRSLVERTDPFVHDFVTSARTLGVAPDQRVTRFLGIPRRAWVVSLSCTRPGHDRNAVISSLLLLIRHDGSWRFCRYTGPLGTAWPGHYEQVEIAELADLFVSDEQIQTALLELLRRLGESQRVDVAHWKRIRSNGNK
ncbi:hypothetical protein ACFROC_01070 [Nocardia tengchongensis]|uniref:hypothetical protein n=1 Tax=Nocardia tengchongensis TaxID=2055889 RepID=UPI0036C9E279